MLNLHYTQSYVVDNKQQAIWNQQPLGLLTSVFYLTCTDNRGGDLVLYSADMAGNKMVELSGVRIKDNLKMF